MEQCNTIFSYENMEKVTRFQQELKEHKNVTVYLQNSFDAIRYNIGNCFKHHYVTHKIFSLGQDGRLTECNARPLAIAKKWVNDIIDQCTGLIQQGLAESITRNILNQKITGALLYNGDISCCEYQKYLATFDLASITKIGNDNGEEDVMKMVSLYKWNSVKVQKFCEDLCLHDVEKIKPILAAYKKIADETNGPFYAYFIRPFRKDDAYNGAMILILTQPLAEHYFNEIGFFLSHVFMEMALHMLDRLKYEADCRLLIGEQHHALKNILGSIKKYVTEAVEANMYNDPGEVQQCLARTLKQTDTLMTFVNFSNFLMKVDENGMAIDKHKQHEYADAYQIEEVKLGELMKRQIITLHATVEDLGINTLEHRESLRKFLTNLVNDDKYHHDLPTIRVIPAAMEILMHELLKNALYHTNKLTPSIAVNYGEGTEGDYVTLSITNNYRINDEAFAFLQTDKGSVNYASQHKGGIRFVKRILNLSFFNFSGKTAGHKWKMEIKRGAPVEPWTSIILKIPYADIVAPMELGPQNPETSDHSIY